MNIPTHRLSEVSDLGLEIHRIPGDFENLEEHLAELGAHRDDHYVFLFQEKGRALYFVDFEDVALRDRGLYFVLPGQVHEIRALTNVNGWFLALDVHLVPEPYQAVLAGVPQAARFLPVAGSDGGELLQCLEMILARRASGPRASDNGASGHRGKLMLHALASAFVGLAVERYAAHCGDGECRKESRSAQVYRTFRALVTARFREEKRPQAYAAALNVSLSYLNEMVRGVSGFPVGHWIQYEVMLEARRQLYYGRRSVQEIAFELGYEDPAYFSRVFRQAVGQSPARFRQLFRE